MQVPLSYAIAVGFELYQIPMLHRTT